MCERNAWRWFPRRDRNFVAHTHTHDAYDVEHIFVENINRACLCEQMFVLYKWLIYTFCLCTETCGFDYSKMYVHLKKSFYILRVLINCAMHMVNVVEGGGGWRQSEFRPRLSFSCGNKNINCEIMTMRKAKYNYYVIYHWVGGGVGGGIIWWGCVHSSYAIKSVWFYVYLTYIYVYVCIIKLGSSYPKPFMGEI